jgi:hypothetical protein
MCTIAQEELKPMNSPRVFSLTKIVEIASFNMSRIRRDRPSREHPGRLGCRAL